MFSIEIILLYNLPVTVLRLVSKGHALKVLRRHTQIIHSNVEPIQTVNFMICFAFGCTSSALKLFVLKRVCLCPLCSFQHPPTTCEQCHEQPIDMWTTCHAIAWTTLRPPQETIHEYLLSLSLTLARNEGSWNPAELSLHPCRL